MHIFLTSPFNQVLKLVFMLWKQKISWVLCNTLPLCFQMWYWLSRPSKQPSPSAAYLITQMAWCLRTTGKGLHLTLKFHPMTVVLPIQYLHIDKGKKRVFYLLAVKPEWVFHRREYGFNQLEPHMGASCLFPFTFSYACLILIQGKPGKESYHCNTHSWGQLHNLGHYVSVIPVTQ